MEIVTRNVSGNASVLQVMCDGYRVDTLTAHVDKKETLYWVNARDEWFPTVAHAEFHVYSEVMAF